MSETNPSVAGGTAANAANIGSFADLFNLYRDLIEPVRQYEAVVAKRQAAEGDLHKAQNTVSSAFILPFTTAISRTLLFAIPWIVLFLIVCNVKHNADGVKWLTLYDTWYGNLWLPTKISEIIAPDKVPLWLGIPIAFLRYFIVENVVAPVVLFLLPLMFAVSIVTTTFAVLNAKMVIRAKQQKIEMLDAELAVYLSELSAAITFVPPDYRFSEAIEFFYHSFANGKASTLQEVILQYDDFSHKRRMEQGQQDILEAHNAMLRELSYQTAQIKKLEGKVNTLNRKVSWL
ncbi:MULTISPECIES: hypothetical protein [unclassified Oscillibacter]|uniref:hypothetical protein n=1 Tax=unclassified Oscillibacter TaxID=2629304 RepID=UPI0025F809F5|nr:MULTISPECIES: hypothetical protein [unclassified Oscillibacter]